MVIGAKKNWLLLTLICQTDVKKKKAGLHLLYSVSLFPLYHDYQIKSDQLERLNSNPNKIEMYLFIYLSDNWHFSQD